ncbi:MAG: methylated-DNA--[protein]-cysteine S-methyltransferase [Alphaproteobacteria bacterium]|nr:methylated-DNA--[protein]-cysteine S-methyltransferase [Alphaproteobacteria bacterium]
MADALALECDRLPTPLGEAVIVSDAQGAVRLFYWDDLQHRWQDALKRRYGAFDLKERRNRFGHKQALAQYFDGDVFAIDRLAVAFAGSPFQLLVWNALRKIAAGTTTSYGALARSIGAPAAVRAVGLANGQNPVGLIAPCHRVIGSDGSLTGYGGGLPRKRWLLEHEARHAGNTLFRKASA